MAKPNTTATTISRNGGDYTIYKVDAGQVTNIDDTTIDANDEIIIAGEDAANDAIDFTQFITITGNKNTSPTAIKNYKRGTNHYQNGLDFLAGANISDVTIESAGYVRCSVNTSTNMVLRNSRFLMLPNAGTSVQQNNTLWYFRNCALDVDGVIVDGGSCALDATKFVKFDNYSPRNMNEGFMTITGRGTDAPHWLALNGFNPISCTKDFAWLNISRYRFYGYPDKIPTGSVHFDHASVNGGYSAAEIRKRLNITARDANNKALITGLKSEVSKVIHNTTEYSHADFLGSDGNHINSAQTYVSSDTDNDGIISFDFLLSYLGVRRVVNVGTGSATRTAVFFTKNNSKEHAFDIPIRIYGYQTKVLADFNLIGLTDISQTEFFLEDTSVVQRTKATVSAYTDVGALDKLHDRATAYYSDNFDVDVISTKTADTLNFGSFNINFNNSGGAFSESSGTVTAKSTTISQTTELKNLVTTGTITIGSGVTNAVFLTDGTRRTIRYDNIPVKAIRIKITKTVGATTTTILDITNNTLATRYFFIEKTASITILPEDENSIVPSPLTLTSAQLDINPVIDHNDITNQIDGVPRTDVTITHNTATDDFTITQTASTPTVSAVQLRLLINKFSEGSSTFEGADSVATFLGNTITFAKKLKSDTVLTTTADIVLPNAQDLIVLNGVTASSVSTGTNALTVVRSASGNSFGCVIKDMDATDDGVSDSVFIYQQAFGGEFAISTTKGLNVKILNDELFRNYNKGDYVLNGGTIVLSTNPHLSNIDTSLAATVNTILDPLGTNDPAQYTMGGAYDRTNRTIDVVFGNDGESFVVSNPEIAKILIDRNTLNPEFLKYASDLDSTELVTIRDGQIDLASSVFLKANNLLTIADDKIVSFAIHVSFPDTLNHTPRNTGGVKVDFALNASQVINIDGNTLASIIQSGYASSQLITDLTTLQTGVTSANTALGEIPTNPVLTIDARLNHLNADVSSAGLDQATFDARVLGLPDATKQGLKSLTPDEKTTLLTETQRVDEIKSAVIEASLL